MNIKGQKIKLRNGEISEILEQTKKKEQVGYNIVLYINGKNKEYDYEKAFKSGFIKLIDDDLQRKVMEEINRLKPPAPKILISKGTHFGTNAFLAYKQLCKRYGFDFSKKGPFAGKDRPLCASKVNDQELGVWFIAHSNWTHTTDDHWKNEISDDEKLIAESWTENTHCTYGWIGEKRLVFAKRNGLYEFLGVFKCTSKFGREKIYKRICEHYTEEKIQ